MKRFYFVLIFITTALFARDIYWDKPTKILDNLYFVNINHNGGKEKIISFLTKEEKGYKINIMMRNADSSYQKAKTVSSPISTDNPRVLNPTAAFVQRRIFVCWKGIDNSIYFTKSENNGDVFLEPRKILTSDETILMPYIYYHNNRIFIFFHKKAESSFRVDISYITSNDGGVTFSAAQNLIRAYSFSFSPFVLFHNNEIHILWESRPPVSGNEQAVPFEIYYKKSKNLGASWTDELRITRNHGTNYNPKAYYFDNKLYAVWESNKEGNFAIYMTTINENENLLPHQRKIERISKTATNCKQANISKHGDFLYIFWKDVRDNVENIYYNTLNIKNNSIGEDRNAIFSRENSSLPYPIIQENNISLIYLDRKGDTFTLNESKPDTGTSAIEVSIPNINTETGYINNRRVNFAWKPIQDISGVYKVYFAIDNSPNTRPIKLESNEVPEGDLKITRELSDGNYYFHIFYIDKAGNESKTTHYKFSVDTSAPRSPQAFLPGTNTFKNKEKNIIGIMNGAIEWIRSEDDYKFEYVLSPYPKFFDHLAKKTTTTNIRFNIPDDGTYYFHIRSIDKANNKSEINTLTFQIQIDPALMPEGIIVRRAPEPRIVISPQIKNVNLPALPIIEINKNTGFKLLSFFEYPFIVRIKYTLIAIFIFFIVLFLLLFYLYRSKSLKKTIKEIRALPMSEIKTLPMPKEYETELARLTLPGEIEIRAVPKESVIFHKNSEDLLLSVDVDISEKNNYKNPETIIYSQTQNNFEESQTTDEVFEDAEPIDEAEGLEDAEPIDEAEGLEGAEPIDEAEGLEDAEPIDEAEGFEDAEPIDEAEGFEDAEPIDEAEGFEDAETIKTAEVTEHTDYEPALLRDNTQHDNDIDKYKSHKEKLKLKEGIFGLRFKYSFLVFVVVLLTVSIGTVIISIFSQKSSQQNLATESIEKVKAVIRSLNYATITGIETNTDFIILENLGFTRRDQDIAESFIVRWALDLQSGKYTWMKLDRDAKNIPFVEQEIFNKVKEIAVKDGRNTFYISPDFNTNKLEESYLIYSPVLRLNVGEEVTKQLLENRTKFLGLVAVRFSTKRVLTRVVEAQRELTQLNILIGIAMLILGVIAAILFTSVMIKPIHNLAYGVQVVGTGDLDYKIKVMTKDEVGALTKEFNKMTTELKKAEAEKLEKQRMEEQFSIAEGIQTSLIPTENYVTANLELVAFYKAALGVGGDYFDFIKIDQDRTAVVICDVAGKGIPAALIMVQIRTIFRSYLEEQNTSAARLLELVNNNLVQTLQAGLFATIFFIIYNEKTRELIFSNAGHGPLEYFCSKTKTIKKVTSETPPTGVMPGIKYNDNKLIMSKGDIVYLFTDGITEAMNINHEEYGSERFEAMIINNNKLSAENLNKTIISDIEKFVGGADQSDDITFIIMKIK